MNIFVILAAFACVVHALASPGTRAVLEKPGEECGMSIAGEKTLKPDLEGQILERRSPDALVITKQEAADVVKAMELLAAQSEERFFKIDMSKLEPQEGDTLESMQLRRDAVILDANHKWKDQRAKDLAWARGVLEAWKEKLEGCK